MLFIKDNIKPQAYKTWFEPIKPMKLAGDVLTIQVPSKFFFEWLEEHYIKLLRVAFVSWETMPNWFTMCGWKTPTATRSHTR